MDIFKIIDDFQRIDGDAAGRLEYATRRHFMSKIGSKLATVAVPTVFASIVNKAFAQSATAIEVLNYALTLEYLEDEFYKAGNAAANLIPASDKAIFTQIGKHETQHVAFLVKALGAQAIKKPTFDFQYGGAFGDVFTNYKTFVTVSSALEDTGVRAYKGQATALKADPQILEYALQVHSVEARHAAVVRRLAATVTANPAMKGWITGKEGAVPAIYAGEENMTQGGVNLKGLASKSDAAVTEAFDEPLTKAAVLAIAGPFIKA
ncbi:ferritin-like domain-containing protein [Dyadobacter sp. LJ53]|uniref:ferritin-like domain-containing protein n=1 Tax=Dyadobacter chenwenxiniae TaxID=2906456 RepID=UPI001F2FC6E1|nr:ferritin-like domain-containing protein [Dyadobacter chenwenxiniae]MCF0053649.1 ferritin-like domain-containing protein [Dyadobacter chenwenxiniae]